MAVIGAGPIGLMFMHVAALHGVHVIAVVKRAEQRQSAQTVGALETVLVGDGEDVIEAVRRLTIRGRGVDIAVDAVASPATWEQAVKMVRKGGLVNFFGGPPSGTLVRLDTNSLHYGDITLKASFHHTPQAARTAFALLSDGRFQAAEYITGRAMLSEVPALFRRMLHRGHAPEQDPGVELTALAAAASAFAHHDIKTAVLPAGVEL